MLKKKIWANFWRIIKVFTQKIVTKLSKYGFGIRKNLFRIPDPGVKKAPDPGSAILLKMGRKAILAKALVRKRTVNKYR